MKELSFELVMYDETEYFRQFNDPEFNYPFIPRKNLINSYKFNIPWPKEDY